MPGRPLVGGAWYFVEIYDIVQTFLIVHQSECRSHYPKHNLGISTGIHGNTDGIGGDWYRRRINGWKRERRNSISSTPIDIHIILPVDIPSTDITTLSQH